MKTLKRILSLGLLALFGGLIFGSCNPGSDVIDEQGLLITQRSQCFMTFFDVLGSDHRTVLVSGSTVIDTVNLTVNAVARYGTNMKRVKPYSSLVTDATVEPKMGVWTDFSGPMQYTVVSGNRQVRKTYTINVTVQP